MGQYTYGIQHYSGESNTTRVVFTTTNLRLAQASRDHRNAGRMPGSSDFYTVIIVTV